MIPFVGTQNVSRDYTMPAIQQRIAELLKRRVSLEKIPGESIEERLEKYKEQRNSRYGLLRGTHQTVLEVAAFILNLPSETLAEGIIDKDEYVNTFSNFFKEGGKRAIIIHYQYMTPPSIESGRWSPQYEHEKQVLRGCVTDGTTEPFYGKSIIVYRLRSDIAFEMKHLLDQ
ncbi:uncharacterized protein LOC122514483 isoform X2 [Polistes fuscatus]|uniref:uncharacterized protein LOC122514483 isoform X2 n=1 Tax=Polistes fuscatus TaxID=30207 RepID=UPI001CA958CE|nr:uncharacterized protein LOC122514483 isoform X2 [Polistes fuscatus]